MPKVYWSVLKADGYSEDMVDVFVNLGAEMGRRGYGYLSCPKINTADARNLLAAAFCATEGHRDDVLVMLDADHEHPGNIVTHLAENPPSCGVVLGLCFSRHEPHNPVAYMLDERGKARPLASWPTGTVEVDALGAGALAIRRWVFDELQAKGVEIPYFRWCYTPGKPRATTGEDFYFSTTCTANGIAVYVDTAIETPHVAKRLITHENWKAHLRTTGDDGTTPIPVDRSFCQVAHDAGHIYGKLTPRLKETLDLIGEGYTNKEIADKLTVSVKTVEANKVRLMDKLDLPTSRQLERVAIMAKARLVEMRNGEQAAPAAAGV